MTRKHRRNRRQPPRGVRRPRAVPVMSTDTEELADDGRLRAEQVTASTVLTGGDVDADHQRAEASGEEAVGGTVATPPGGIMSREMSLMLPPTT